MNAMTEMISTIAMMNIPLPSQNAMIFSRDLSL